MCKNVDEIHFAFDNAVHEWDVLFKQLQLIAPPPKKNKNKKSPPFKLSPSLIALKTWEPN